VVAGSRLGRAPQIPRRKEDMPAEQPGSAARNGDVRTNGRKPILLQTTGFVDDRYITIRFFLALPPPCIRGCHVCSVVGEAAFSFPPVSEHRTARPGVKVAQPSLDRLSAPCPTAKDWSKDWLSLPFPFGTPTLARCSRCACRWKRKRCSASEL